MLKFKQFVAEQDAPIEQGVVVNGVPNVLIEKGIKQGALDTKGRPCALIGSQAKKPSLYEKEEGQKWTNVNDNAHLGSRVSEVHHKLVEGDKTIEADKEHLRKYSDDSSHLNRELFKANKYGRTTDRHIGEHDTKGIDAAVNRNKLKHDLHVYSGVGFHPGHMAARHPEGHVHLAAYTSTSIEKHTAMDFAGDDEDGHQHIIHFHLKKGQKGKYMAPHASPDVQHEHEFLLPRHTTVKIHPEPSVHYGAGQLYHVWHAHVVDSK